MPLSRKGASQVSIIGRLRASLPGANMGVGWLAREAGRGQRSLRRLSLGLLRLISCDIIPSMVPRRAGVMAAAHARVIDVGITKGGEQK